MFKSISWQEYQLAVGLLALGYYAVIVSIFYSRDILLKLKGGEESKSNQQSSSLEEKPAKLMGSISQPVKKKIPLKQSVIIPEELTFESDPEEMVLAQREDSIAAELIEALDDLFTTMAVKKAQRPEYIIHMRKLFEVYSDLNMASAKQDIYSFIHDNLKSGELIFSTEELDSLWLDENEEVIHKSTTKSTYEK